MDWTSGEGAGQHWITSSTGCNYMTVASMESAGRRRDVIFTTELRKSGGYRITANELPLPPAEPSTRMIYTSPHRIEYLQTAHEGTVLVGISGNKILIGRLKSPDFDTVGKIRYEFRVFESIDAIKCLDMRVSFRTGAELEGLKKSSMLKKTPIVDLVVGDVKGVVFLHDDLLAKLFIQAQDGTLPSGVSIIPRKMHWHRQAVQTVKWSLDGKLAAPSCINAANMSQAIMLSQVALKRSWFCGNWIPESINTCLICQQPSRTLLFPQQEHHMAFSLVTTRQWSCPQPSWHPRRTSLESKPQSLSPTTL